MTDSTTPKVVRINRVLLTYPQCEDTKESLLEHLKTLRNYSCSIIARESHHETEGHHLHAFVRFSPSYQCTYKTFALTIAFNGHTADIRFLKTEKDVSQAIAYVKKDGDILNDGIADDASKHRRKYALKEILSHSFEDVVENDMIPLNSLRTFVWAKHYYALVSKGAQDAEDVRGVWLWGPAGSGKSYAARMIGGDSLYLKPQSKWWDGYEGQDYVLLDDLDTMTLSHYLKIWDDKYACTGEIKGATVPLPFKRFIVTSNYSIRQLMDKDRVEDEGLFEALYRRFVQHRITSHEESDEVIALYSHNKSHDQSHNPSHLDLFASTSPSGYM